MRIRESPFVQPSPRALLALSGAVAIVACGPGISETKVSMTAPPVAAFSAPPAPARPRAPVPPEPAPEASRDALLAWLRERLPQGGEIDDRGLVVHTVRLRESFSAIAEKYVDLTEIYAVDDLAKALRAQTGLPKWSFPRPGTRLVVPQTVAAPPVPPDKARLGWPDDHVLRGVYVRGATAGGAHYTPLLDRLAERGMNAIVLDAKDYDGLLTYPSTVPLAVEAGATKRAPVRDLGRAIRFAHRRGILVAVRVSCFEDELLARARGDLSVQSVWGRPYRIGWLDPANEGAQKYLLDLVEEAMLAGADEIQLDYVRYPVLGIKDADFALEKRKLTKTGVITDFVHKVHAVTRSHGVPLSLDVFGVVAEGRRVDIESLGQDPVLLAPECEALSPMVYPSHYTPGYQGFDVPGNHPEIVGISTRKILAQLADGGVRAVVRPWLQAASFNSPDYGPKWVAAEIRHAEAAGGTGWLMWNPAQTYTVTFRAVPRLRSPADDPEP
jgi:hypothetical protein